MSDSLPLLEAAAIVRDAFDRYIAPDGGMRLSPGEDREPYAPGLPRTAGNDNPALFRVYFDWLTAINGVMPVDHAESFRSMAALFQKAGVPGAFLRNPGRNSAGEALDDYRAWASGSVLHDCPEIAAAICDFGDEHGYIFDVESPGRENLRCWRQGSDIAFYQLARGRTPELGNLAWLCLGFIFQAFQSPAHTSEHLLTFITSRALILKLQRDNPPRSWRYALPILFSLVWAVGLSLRTGGRGIEAVFDLYFLDLEHPNRKLSQEIRA